MKLDKSQPLNQYLLRYLQNPKRLHFNSQPIVAPDMHPDPYWKAGSHPEIVERVWDILGSALPVDCRAVVYGTPALVHPDKGVVFALVYGTQYAIRVPNELIYEAVKIGCKKEQEWTGGRKTNIEEELGEGWLFGCWAEGEKQWLTRSYNDLCVNIKP
jgi:hypothetical protein